MIQQESRLRVADNTGDKKSYFASVLWAVLQEDMLTLVMLLLLQLKMQHQAELLKKGDVVKAVVVRTKKRRTS